MNTYVVKYWGGSGGHFLQELILWCETQSDEILTYPHGHAHTVLDNWVYKNVNHPGQSADQHILKTQSDYNFLITFGGSPAHIKNIYDQSPENFRMVRVVIEDTLDVALCNYNHFYKNQRIEPFNKDYGLFEYYQTLVQNNVINILDRKPDDPIVMPIWKNISTEDIVHILRAMTLDTYKTRDDMIGRENPYALLKEEVSYEELTIKEVGFGSPRVLEVISKLVGKPVTSTMQTNFDRYQQAQTELRETFPAYHILRDTYGSWNPEIKTN